MSDDSMNPQNPPADAVVPAPPETPVPDGALPPEPVIPPSSAVIPPPPADIPSADAVIPPPPPEAMMPSSRSARRKPILEGDQPSAVADDWAKPSVAPEVPTTGAYRGISAAIFVFLLLLLAAAVALAIYLATTTSFSFAAAAPGFSVDATAATLLLPTLRS